MTSHPDLPPVLDPAYSRDVAERLPSTLSELKAFNDGVKRGRSEILTLVRPVVQTLAGFAYGESDWRLSRPARTLAKATLEAFEATLKALQNRP